MNLLDLLFPPRCPFCRKIQRVSGVCAACARVLPRTEGRYVLRKEGDFVCAAPLWYEGIAREGILSFKFHGAQSAGREFGAMIARCAAEEFSGRFDTVTWVPVSRKRLRSRGFDQSRILAEEACRCWDTKPRRLLRKIGDNPAQSTLKGGDAARRANVLGMYDPEPKAEIAGKRVLLIDDICTSGATLRECVRVLRAAGAEDVVCAALAHTREYRKSS
jgi:ComF family protein